MFSWSLPNWAEGLQAIAACIGIPLTVFTLYKLVKRDKDREAEIANLAHIVENLNKMLTSNEKRHRASRRPYINVMPNNLHYPHKLTLNFNNINANSSLVHVAIDNINVVEASIMKTVINSHGKTQSFDVEIEFNDEFDDFLSLDMEYTTEEGYTYIQDVHIIDRFSTYEVIPKPVIDKDNMAI